MGNRQTNASDGQDVILIPQRRASLLRTASYNRGGSAINVRNAADTVPALQRGGPGINQWGTKDCSTCYRSLLVLDEAFCSL